MPDDDRVFLETTRRLAPPGLARQDVRTALALLRADVGSRLADLGCGYGRHLSAFVEMGLRPIGIDKSELLTNDARSLAPGAIVLRGDLRRLPLRAASLDGAACFYSSMFLGTEQDAQAALAEARRVLKQGAGLVVTTDNPLRLMASPRSDFSEDIPGLGRVTEESRFDPATFVDTVRRRVERDGRTLQAEFRIRYFLPDALGELARSAGLRLERLEPHALLTEQTPQLVALLRRLG